MVRGLRDVCVCVSVADAQNGSSMGHRPGLTSFCHTPGLTLVNVLAWVHLDISEQGRGDQCVRVPSYFNGPEMVSVNVSVCICMYLLVCAAWRKTIASG